MRRWLSGKIDAMNPTTAVSKQHEHQHKARRLRGGGAARVCPLPPLPHRSPHSAPWRQSLSHAAAHHIPPALPPDVPLTRFFPISGLLHWHDRVLYLLRYVLFSFHVVK